jgi:hypothetical protein
VNSFLIRFYLTTYPGPQQFKEIILLLREVILHLATGKVSQTFNMRNAAVLTIGLIFSLTDFAQINNANYQQDYQLKMVKAADLIKVDGILDETSWQTAHFINNFWQKFPVDTGKAHRQTEVRMTYDNNFLYAGIICYDTSYYVIQTLKRDVDPGSSDGVALVLDPVNARSNGFLFAVNPYNVQAEDLLSASNYGDINFSWDNKWFSQTTRHPDKWIVEMAIPFKTLRYDAGKTVWGLNFIRADLKNNEYSTWTKVPINLQFYDFGHTGALVWDTPPPSPGRNISLIPFTRGGVNSDAEEGKGAAGDFSAGFDAKIALSSQLNLDVTVNPDFSQVEVDQQVTNLTRFDIFFPERRTFFIENADLFANYGIPPIRPFYSRTIGLDKDANTVQLYGGLRLTGNLTKRTRIGVMNMQTGKTDEFAARNYTAISVHQSVLKRSFIKAYYLGVESFMTEEEKQQKPLERYGRNAGLELTYVSNNGSINGWYSFHQSWKYGIHTDDHYMNYGFGYFKRKFTAMVNYDGVGTNYYTDMGFVQRIENYDAELDTTIRLGFKSIFSQLQYTMFPKKGSLNSHSLNLENFIVWNPDGSLNERQTDFAYQFNFKNTSEFRASATNQDVRLLFPTSFTDDDNDEPLPRGTYKFTNYRVKYESDKRKKFVYTLALRRGGFYNGTIHQYIAEILFRAQPWGNFSVMFERNALEFPDPYGSTSLYLIAPKIEINFSNSIFWTTFIQYNTQNNNINFNSRFQWRFKPMSDIFLVYTDNYYSDPFFKNRNRAVVLKMNWWLNL